MQKKRISPQPHLLRWSWPLRPVPLIHPLCSQVAQLPNWLTLCFFTCVKIGREKANSDLPFHPVPSNACTLKKNIYILDHLSCYSLLQISQCCLLSHSPFLTALRNNSPFVSDAFPRKKCSLTISLLSTQGAHFCPILRQIPVAVMSMLQMLYSTTEMYQKWLFPSLHQKKNVRCDGCYSEFVLKR